MKASLPVATRICLLACFPLTSMAQVDVYNRSDSGSGLWWDNSNPWYYTGWDSTNQSRPDQPNETTRNNVYYDHNNNTTSTVNGAWFQLRSLTIQSSATSDRTFNSSYAGGISLSTSFTNDSTGSHTFNVPIGIDGTTVTFNANAGAAEFTDNFYLNSNTAAFTGSASMEISGLASGSGGNITKSGTGTLTLSGDNTYTGTTTASAGTLIIDGDQSAATGAVNINAEATLKGTGTIGGATTISGTHAPGNSIGTQTFVSSLTYSSGSIFEWELDVDGSTSTYDKVIADSLSGSGAIFKITLDSADSYDATFWDTNQTWTDIFTGYTGSLDLATIFSGGFQYENSTPDLLTQGSFSFSGNTLNWSAVPEPSSAIAGLLLITGLMHRRR